MKRLILKNFVVFFSLICGIISSRPVFAENEIFQGKASSHKETLPQRSSCSMSSCKVDPLNTKAIQVLQEEGLTKAEGFEKSKEFEDLQREVLQRKDLALENKEFQHLVSKLQEKVSNVLSACQDTDKISGVSPQAYSPKGYNPEGSLYIFISFSLGEKALLNLAHEAQRYEATLVLRGFKDGSYKKTVQALQNIILETGQGVSIDPELFTLFSVTSVPTYVLTKPIAVNPAERNQTPLHDRLQGHVSVRYALESFSKEGDLQNEAKDLLVKAGLQDPFREKGKDK